MAYGQQDQALCCHTVCDISVAGAQIAGKENLLLTWKWNEDDFC